MVSRVCWTPAYAACLCKDVMVHAPLGPPSPGVPAVHSTFRSFHQPWEIDQSRQLAAGTHYVQPIYCTDIVPIKVYTQISHTSLCAVCMFVVIFDYDYLSSFCQGWCRYGICFPNYNSSYINDTVL